MTERAERNTLLLKVKAHTHTQKKTCLRGKGQNTAAFKKPIAKPLGIDMGGKKGGGGAIKVAFSEMKCCAHIFLFTMTVLIMKEAQLRLCLQSEAVNKCVI